MGLLNDINRLGIDSYFKPFVAQENVYTLSSPTHNKFEHDICSELELLSHKIETVVVFWRKSTNTGWKRKKNAFPGDYIFSFLRKFFFFFLYYQNQSCRGGLEVEGNRK